MSLLGKFDPLGYFIHLPDVEKGDVAAAFLHSEDLQIDPRNTALIRQLATLVHEYAHFVHVSSTPFGHFWTRSLCAHGGFARLTIMALVAEEQNLRIALPISANHDDGTEQSAVLRGVVIGWETIESLVTSLISDFSSPLHAKLAELNKAFGLVLDFGYTDRGLPGPRAHVPTIATNLEAGSLTLPEGELKTDTLSTVNLLEVHAQIMESMFVREFGTAEDFGDIERRAEAAGHSKVLQIMGILHQQVIEYSDTLISTMMALIDLALFAPLDPIWSAEWSRHLLWEDIHPAYRFVQAARVTAEIGLLENDQDFESFQNKICDRLGWPSPRKIMSDLLPVLAKSASVYDRFACECFRIRLENPSAFSFPIPQSKVPVPLIIYNDEAEWISLPFSIDDNHIAPLLTHYLGHEMTNKLLFSNSARLTAPANVLEPDADRVLQKIFHLKPGSIIQTH